MRCSVTIDDLNPNQRKCAELAAKGIPNAEIAKLTSMNLRTVKAHLGRVFVRFGIHHGHKRTRLAALLNNPQPVPLTQPFRLARKEHDIAALVAQGLKNKEVAIVLGTTEHVVKNYMRFLYDLSGMSNRTEFSAWWQANHKAALLYDSPVPSRSGREWTPCFA